MADNRVIDSDVDLIVDALVHHNPENDPDTARVALAALAGAERLRSDDLSGVEIQLRAALAECALPRRDATPAGPAFWDGAAYALKRLAKRLGIEL